jgi:hypothetical protein
MSLISYRVKENAKKCNDCAIMKMRNNIDSRGVLNEQAQIVAEGVVRISCNVCPFAMDFEKIYGKKPYQMYPGIS